MKILLIEDNVKIANNIKQYLKMENIDVDIAWDWMEWLEKLTKDYYDLVLLDIMLPKLDWILVCQNIRKSSELPIIMITAKSQLEDKMNWFDCWADDYITKPFDLPELLARIRSLMKRVDKFDKFIYKDIQILPEKKQILKNWQEINLTLKEFSILNYLLDNYWRSVSRTDIIDYVWWEDTIFEWDEKLDVYISNLRRKLDKNLIKTVKWYWYKIDKD